MKAKRVLIAAGGSGGHLFPAQQLAEKLKTKCQVTFAGHKLVMSSFFHQESFPFFEIAAAPFRRGFFFKNCKGFWQSLHLLRSLSPDLIIGFGSYHTFPLLLAARVLRKRLILFEANCVLGRVNRLFLGSAEKVASQFALPIEEKKAALVPLLPWKELASPSPAEARCYFGLSCEKCTLLVFGGSQGAAFLNRMAPAACHLLRRRGIDLQVLHLTGEEGRTHYTITSCVKPFEKEMAYAYRAADIALCRSGASTLAELVHFTLPALLIPFPSAAHDHQRTNAQVLAEELQGALFLDESEATEMRIAEELERLLRERQKHVEALVRYRLENQRRASFDSLILEAL